MTKRNSAIALGTWAAVTGFAFAVSTRRGRRRRRDVTANRVRAARTVTVRRDADTLYGMWRDPQAVPRFFRGVSGIEATGDAGERWTLAGGSRAVDVTIVDDVPAERIEWRAPKLGRFAAQGSVTFLDAGDRGTEVRLTFALAGPTAKTTAAFARLFGDAPPQIAAESLRAFKALAETGEIPQAVRN